MAPDGTYLSVFSSLGLDMHSVRMSKRVPVTEKRQGSASAGPLLDPGVHTVPVSVCVFQSWFDHYLQWNQSEHPGVKNLRFTTEQIWTPDILLYNR